MSEHKPVREEVVTIDCLYGECDNTDHDELPECPAVSMLVCDTCREPWSDDPDYELFVGWPCEHAPSSPNSGEGE